MRFEILDLICGVSEIVAGVFAVTFISLNFADFETTFEIILAVVGIVLSIMYISSGVNDLMDYFIDKVLNRIRCEVKRIDIGVIKENK